jgi:hypothetical protein
MDEVTLKVNMILGGQHYSRGSVVDRELLPSHLTTNKHIVNGAVHINRVMPIDMIAIEDDLDEQEVSPMRELTMEEVQPPLKPKFKLKPKLRRI